MNQNQPSYWSWIGHKNPAKEDDRASQAFSNRNACTMQKPPKKQKLHSIITNIGNEQLEEKRKTRGVKEKNGKEHSQLQYELKKRTGSKHSKPRLKLWRGNAIHLTQTRKRLGYKNPMHLEGKISSRNEYTSYLFRETDPFNLQCSNVRIIAQ